MVTHRIKPIIPHFSRFSPAYSLDHAILPHPVPMAAGAAMVAVAAVAAVTVAPPQAGLRHFVGAGAIPGVGKSELGELSSVAAKSLVTN